jgi:hypothetical protein
MNNKVFILLYFKIEILFIFVLFVLYSTFYTDSLYLNRRLINSILYSKKFVKMTDLLAKIRDKLSVNFNRCIQGYHLVNGEPAKESVWENLNEQIFVESGCPVESKSSGSHSPGSDITCALGNISNKSAKYDNDGGTFNISSYRLTTLCSSANCGNIDEIIHGINAKKNFHYYSIIVREETGGTYKYDWYLVPSDYPAFDPASYEWSPMIGQRGQNKDKQVGWRTNLVNGSSMSITFSMSSQLWISICVTEDLRQYIVGSSISPKDKRYNYMQLHQLLEK